jgi:hypothetical protein
VTALEVVIWVSAPFLALSAVGLVLSLLAAIHPPDPPAGSVKAWRAR